MALSFAVGDLTIHRIIEDEGPFAPALDLINGLTPELLAENRHWLVPTSIDAQGNLIICFQSYVVQTPHHTILVDTCIGNHKQRGRLKWNMKADDVYMRALRLAGFSVEDIDYVMCTHLHVDHVGWNTRLENGTWLPTFPNARYVFGKREYDHFAMENKETPDTIFADSVLPIVEAGRADLVSSEHMLGDHVRLLPTPGHTPGHVAICFGRDGQDAVMCGDLIHSPLQMRYPQLSVNADRDKKQAALTRRSFLERYCDTRTICCTSHFPSPSAVKIKRWGEGFRCEDIDSV